MLRAMDSAVAGLRAHQNKMDVIGHNLANVNTFGYKSQTYSFKEAMYQTSTASTGGNENAGGSNAAQYGYGTLMGNIGMDMIASTPTYAGGLNATINGEGFFLTSAVKYNNDKQNVVQGADGNPIEPKVTNFKEIGADWDYTRVGQFLVDSNGYLVDGNGNFVYGFREGDNTFTKDEDLQPIRIPTNIVQKTENGIISYEYTYGVGATDKPCKATNISINKLGEITASLTGTKKTGTGDTATTTSNTYSGVPLGKVVIVTFQNPNGLTKGGGTYYKSTNKDNSGRADAAVPGGEVAELMPGYIENSNVDLAKEFSEMITTHRGFQANSKMVTVSDEMLSDLVSMKR